ncbi:MAG: 5-(carboxyamino)imidazole ribonucleotide synthase [Acidimicrobiales bacterium]|nr:5-(carboxyamino)imidazole ribonucleotide synthase [Acidimicrobiales bacterium]
MPNSLPAIYPLGIVGSGQIARMIHTAALQLGITPRLMAEDSGDSAALAAPEASFRHPDALSSFAELCEVVTFEHERVDLGMIEYMEEAGTIIRPGTKALRAAMDKAHQRRILLNRGFNVPPFAELWGPDDVIDFAGMFGWPTVIKSVRSGGQADRGAWIVDNQSDALRVMAEQFERELIIEAFQPIVKELVVVVARRPGGNARCYPVAEAVNIEGVCKEIRSPAAIGSRVATEAMETARKIADELDAQGVIAVEFFLTTAGLVVNEIAARPHNAGHHTIENAPTSQFENHVRAVLDLPLGPTHALNKASVTINVIGGIDPVNPADHLHEALAVEGAHIHLYGKRPRPNRKLGHVTAVGDDMDQVRELARRAEAALMNRRVS